MRRAIGWWCWLPVLLAGLAEAVAAAESPGEPIVLRRETLLPPDSDALAWRWQLKLANLGPSNGGTRDEFADPACLERRMKELSEAGYNAVICNGMHFHLCHLHQWAMWKENSAKVVAAAHRHGLKVIEHYDVPVVFWHGNGLRYTLDHADWLQRDVRFDCPNLHAMCLNHPGFRKEYLSRLEDFARTTGIDAVMLDECCFADDTLCGCRYCREKFHQDTGCTLPLDDSSGVLFNVDDRLWVTWLKWRVKSVGDWWLDVRRTLNKVNPNISIMTYTTHGGFTTNPSMRKGGGDIADRARGCDFLGTEIMSRNVFDCNRAVFAYRKMKSALGRHFGSPIYGLVYHLHDENFAYFGWALCHMNGQATWMATIEGADMKRYIDWAEQMDNRRAKPVADIAVLFSQATRDFTRLLSHVPDMVGMSECLTDVHLQHDFVLEGDLRPEVLRGHKLLVLPSCCCLGAEEVRQILRYVSEGGRLLVSGHTSLYNEDGFGGENFQLAEVMGVDYGGGLARGPLTLGMRDGRELAVAESAVKVRLREGAEGLGELRDGKGQVVGPGIVVNRFGKGECVYMAARLAALNYQREMTTQDEWTYSKNEAALRLLIELVQRGLGDSPVLRAVHVPEKVLMSVYRQEHNGQEQRLVHLLNATGARLEVGQTVPSKKRLPAFPAVQEDLVFDIRSHGPCRGYIVSPDYAGRRPVKVAEAGDGYQRITVAKADLQAYAIVYLESAAP